MKHLINVAGLGKVVVFLMVCCLGACASSGGKKMAYGDIENSPSQIVYTAQSYFTDSGRVQMTMEAPVANNYSGAEVYQEFPSGVHSIFWDEKGSKNVDIIADSAINLQKDKMMKFYGNVVVKDYRSGDTLYTEALYWNQQTRKIYSDVYVKKVSKGLILEGDGFDSDEEMINVVLRKPRGLIL